VVGDFGDIEGFKREGWYILVCFSDGFGNATFHSWTLGEKRNLVKGKIDILK